MMALDSGFSDVPIRGPAVTPAPSLTPREYEVLRAYARLGQQKTVAHEMRVSDQTVKNHLSSAYRKLGATSAIGAFQTLGWLQLPDEAPTPAKFEWRLTPTTIHTQVEWRLVRVA